MLSRELKKGSAELLILSLVEARPRHGYEISKLIEERSGGRVKFKVASLYPAALPPGRAGLDRRQVDREGGRAAPPLLSADRRGPAGAGARSATTGANSSTRFDRSRGLNMPDPSRTSGSPRARALASRLARLALRPAREREIIDELSQHLDDRYQELRAGGASHADAMRAGDRRNTTTTICSRARCGRCARRRRPSRSRPAAPRRGLLGDAWQDLVYAARMLRKSPASPPRRS